MQGSKKKIINEIVFALALVGLAAPLAGAVGYSVMKAEDTPEDGARQFAVVCVAAISALLSAGLGIQHTSMSETKKILVTQQVQVVLAFFAMELVKTFYGSPRVEWTSESAGKDALVLLPFLECVLSSKNIVAYLVMAANYDKLPGAIKSNISKQNATLWAGMFGEVGAILAGGQILSTIPGAPPFIVASEAFAAVIFAVTVFLIAAINMRGAGVQPAQSRYARLTDKEAGNSLLELSRDTSMAQRISPALAFGVRNYLDGESTAVNFRPA